MSDSTGKDPSSPSELSTSPRSRTVAFVYVQLFLVAIGFWAYLPTISRLFEAWASNPDYSHGYFVVPISLYLLWTRRDLRPDASGQVNLAGLLVLAAAGLMRFAAGRFYLPELDGWSLPIWLGGTVLLLHGRSWLKWTLPSLAFLWFATPLPASVGVLLSTPLQHLAAELGAWSLLLMGQQAIVEGTTILMNEHVLDIERACSGLRMFHGILAMAVASMIYLRVRGWLAACILLATAPIAIAANVFRITLTGLLLQVESSTLSNTLSHDLAGYLMTPVALLLLALFCIWLRQTRERFERTPAVGGLWLTKWALALLIGTGLLLSWGHVQQRHLLTALLDKAEVCKQAEDWTGSAFYLRRYLQADSDNTDVMERYAVSLAKSAENREERLRAISIAIRAWKNNPKRIDLAADAGKTAYQIGEINKALQICEGLLKSELPQSHLTGIQLLYADCLVAHFQTGNPVGKYSWGDLASALEATRSLNTSEIHYEVELARVWQEKMVRPDRQERHAIASGVMDDLVLKHSQNPMSWLSRHQFALDFSDLSDSERAQQSREDLTHALNLISSASPANQTHVYLAASAQALRSGETSHAEEFLELAIKTTPTNPRPYVILSELKRSQGSSESKQAALSILKDALEVVGEDDIDLLLPMASLQTELQEFAGAEISLSRVDEQLLDFTGRAQAKLRLGAGIVRAQLLWHREGSYPAMHSLESLINEDEIQIHRQLSPQLFAQAHVLLGRLYNSVDILDRASEQYRSALQLTPDSVAIRNEALLPVLNSGDLESAELLSRQLQRRDPNSETALITMIRVQTRRQLRLPVASRDWTAAERNFRRAEELGIPASTLLPAELELLESQGKAAQATSRLEEALAHWPEQAFLWRESALLFSRMGEITSALESADRYAALSPNSLEPLVLKATFLERLNRSDEATELLGKVMQRSSGTQRTAAALELARLQLLLGQLDQARELFGAVLEWEPANLVALNSLANLAWATGDWKSLARYELQLMRHEGESGTLWRFHRGQRLLEQATSTLDPAFETVTRLSHDLQQLRPRWSKTSLLRGNIALRAGNISAAIEAYQRSWELGDRSALLADRLIELLNEQGRPKEAQSYVMQVQDSIGLSSRLFDRAIPYYVQEHQSEALRLAANWAERHPTEAQAHLRLGRVHMELSVLGNTDSRQHLEKAAESFAVALKHSPGSVGVWLANIECAQRVRGSGFSLPQTLKELTSHAKMEPGLQALVLAEIYEHLGRPKLAREQYRQAEQLARRSGDRQQLARILAKTAAFYLRIVPTLAEQHAREALSIDSTLIQARLVLLEWLSSSPSPEHLEEALTLATETKGLRNEADIDSLRRNRARILAQLGAPQHLDQAIEMQQSLLRQTSEDRLALADFYEQAGRIGPAYEILSRQAISHTASPRDQIAFLEFWQRQFVSDTSEGEQPKFYSTAEAIYQRLQERPSYQADWLRLKLRQGQLSSSPEELTWDDVRPLLDQLMLANSEVRSWTDSAKIAWCRSLMLMFCDEKNLNFALQLVAQPPSGISEADAAITLCHALILTPTEEAEFSAAHIILVEKLTQHAERADLAQAIGDLMLMKGRYDLAVNTYRRSLQLDSRSMLARNNLVLSLAEIPGQADEAQAVLDEAFQKFGPDPVLLDTQATLDLIGDRPEQALHTLQKVLADSDENAVALVHVSMAHQELGDFSKMRDAYLDALSLGLNTNLLSVRDREFCRTMSERLSKVQVDAEILATQIRPDETN